MLNFKVVLNVFSNFTISNFIKLQILLKEKVHIWVCLQDKLGSVCLCTLRSFGHFEKNYRSQLGLFELEYLVHFNIAQKLTFGSVIAVECKMYICSWQCHYRQSGHLPYLS